MRHMYKTIIIIIVLTIVFFITAQQIVHSQKYIDSDLFSFWLDGFAGAGIPLAPLEDGAQTVGRIVLNPVLF